MLRRRTHAATHGADVGNLEPQSETSSFSKATANGEPAPFTSWDDGEETTHDGQVTPRGAENHSDDVRNMLHQIIQTSHSPKIYVEFLPSCTRHTVEVLAPQESAGQELGQFVDQLLSLKGNQQRLSFGMRLPRAPEGEQGKLVVGGMVLDIDAIGGESATLGVPAVKLVKWLSVPQRSHESTGWIDVSSWAPAKRSGLMLVTGVAVWFLGCMAYAVHHGRGLSEGVGVQSLARNVLEAQLERNLAGIPVTHDNPMYEQYHQYYFNEYQRLVAQAETAAARRETILRFYGASVDCQVLQKAVIHSIIVLLLSMFFYLVAKVGGLSGQDSHSVVETVWALVENFFPRRNTIDDVAASREEPHKSSEAFGSKEYEDAGLQRSDSMTTRQALEQSMFRRDVEEPVLEIEQSPRDSFQEELWADPAHDALSDSKSRPTPNQLRPMPVGNEKEHDLPLAVEGLHGQPVLANWPMSQRSLLLEGAAEKPPVPQPRIDYGASPQRQKLQRKIAARERGQLQNSVVGGQHSLVSGTPALKSPGGVGDAASAPSASMHGSSTCKDDPLCDETAVEALLRELEDTPKVSKKKRHALQRQPTQGQRGAKGSAVTAEAMGCSNSRAQSENVASVNLKSSQVQQLQPQPQPQPEPQPQQPKPQPQQQQQQALRSRAAERAVKQAAEQATGLVGATGRPDGRGAGRTSNLAAGRDSTQKRQGAITAQGVTDAERAASQGEAVATVADVESEACGGNWDIALRRRAKRRTSAAPETGLNGHAATVVSAPPSNSAAATRNSHSMHVIAAVPRPLSPLLPRPDTASTLLPPNNHTEGGRLGGCRSKAAAASRANAGKNTVVASTSTPMVETPSQPVWVTATVVPEGKDSVSGDVEAANAVLEELQQMRKDELLRWFSANQALEWLSERLSGAQEMECTPRSVLLEHAAMLLGATSCHSSSSSSNSGSKSPEAHQTGLDRQEQNCMAVTNQAESPDKAAIEGAMNEVDSGHNTDATTQQPPKAETTGPVVSVCSDGDVRHHIRFGDLAHGKSAQAVAVEVLHFSEHHVQQKPELEQQEQGPVQQQQLQLQQQGQQQLQQRAQIQLHPQLQPHLQNAGVQLVPMMQAMTTLSGMAVAGPQGTTLAGQQLVPVMFTLPFSQVHQDGASSNPGHPMQGMQMMTIPVSGLGECRDAPQTAMAGVAAPAGLVSVPISTQALAGMGGAYLPFAAPTVPTANMGLAASAQAATHACGGDDDVVADKSGD